MDDKLKEREDNTIDIYRACCYLKDHPIMAIGVGVSITILAICKIIDENKEMK